MASLAVAGTGRAPESSDVDQVQQLQAELMQRFSGHQNTAIAFTLARFARGITSYGNVDSNGVIHHRGPAWEIHQRVTEIYEMDNGPTIVRKLAHYFRPVEADGEI